MSGLAETISVERDGLWDSLKRSRCRPKDRRESQRYGPTRGGIEGGIGRDQPDLINRGL